MMAYVAKWPSMKITGFADGRNVVIERQNVETVRLTPATVTVATLDAAFTCDDVPTSSTSDLSAFNNKSLLVNQCLTASEHISSVDSLL